MSDRPKQVDLPDIYEDILESRTEKVIETRVWDLVRAFLEDKQTGLVFDTRTGMLAQSSQRSARGTLQFNLLKPGYRTLTSMLTINVPGIKTRPASGSIDDIVKSQSNDLAALYWWHSEKLPELVKRKLLPWLIETGNGFVHTRYSSDQQKVVATVVSPYDCYPEPGNIDPEEVQWWAVKQAVPKADLVKRFPKQKDAIEQYGDDAKRDQMGQFQDAKVPKGRVDVYYCYWRDGKCGIALGHDWLWTAEKPFGYLTFFRYTYFAGKLWSDGPFKSVLDHQSAINRRENAELDSADLCANPMWMVPTGSLVNPSALSNKPGKVAEFNPVVGPPQRVMGVTMPPDFAGRTASLQAEVYEMLGLNAVMLGKRVIGVGSGKGMEVLADKSAGQLQMTMSDLEIGLVDVTTSALKLIKRFYKEPLLVKMLGQEGRIVSESLDVENFDDAPEVFFQADSLFRSDIQDMEARTMDLYDRKLIDPDEATQRLQFSLGAYRANKKMMAWAHAQKLLAAAAGKLGANKGIEILPSDDLKSIGEVFQEFMQTDDYYALPISRQDYIAAILASLSAGGNMTADQLAEASKKRIWPAQPHNPVQAQQMNVAAGSPQAQAQIAGQADQMQQLGAAMGPDQVGKAMDQQGALAGAASAAPGVGPARLG